MYLCRRIGDCKSKYYITQNITDRYFPCIANCCCVASNIKYQMSDMIRYMNEADQFTYMQIVATTA
jgi:hypothetical protein